MKITEKQSLQNKLHQIIKSFENERKRMNVRKQEILDIFYNELGILKPKKKKVYKRTICIEPKCKSRAFYNNYGVKKPIYCKKGKMINVDRKFCEYTGCPITPNFNYSGEKTGICCKKHKKPTMVDIRHKHCLECDTQSL